MTRQPLKIMAFIAVLSGMQAGVSIHAAISMTSVQHRVWGNVGNIEVDHDEYDEISTSPLSGGASIFNYGIPFVANSSASDWSVQAYRAGDAHFANAYAQNTYVFKPFSREISISLNGVIGVWWFENQARMTLTNLTDNTLVSSYYSPSYTNINPFGEGENNLADYHFIWNATVEVNPEDDYELVIYAGARRGEGGDGSASLSLALIPEPGTALLAGMAALIMCGRRHRPAPAV